RLAATHDVAEESIAGADGGARLQADHGHRASARASQKGRVGAPIHDSHVVQHDVFDPSNEKGARGGAPSGWPISDGPHNEACARRLLVARPPGNLAATTWAPAKPLAMARVRCADDSTAADPPGRRGIGVGRARWSAPSSPP